MRNIKDQVYAALNTITGIHSLTDVYPRSWENLPAVEYQEEQNTYYDGTDSNVEQFSQVRYVIHIWNNGSTSLLAVAVDNVMTPLGLRRVFCSDVDDPSGLRHKVMRYEGIISTDENDPRVYHEIN